MGSKGKVSKHDKGKGKGDKRAIRNSQDLVRLVVSGAIDVFIVLTKNKLLLCVGRLWQSQYSWLCQRLQAQADVAVSLVGTLTKVDDGGVIFERHSC